MTEFVSASVVQTEPGIYSLQWQLLHPGAVTVFRSNTVGGEYEAVAETHSSHLQVTVAGNAPRQHFLLQSGGAIVSVAERRLAFEGTPNLRDFGGYIGAEGRRVRWGKMYRSGRLSRLTPLDQDSIRQLGISRIFDFRRQEELRISPTVLLEDVNIHHLPIGEGSHTGFFDMIRSGNLTSEEASQIMKDIYGELAIKHGAEYRQVFGHLLDHDSPFLIHCTAGKDRTGVGAALILMLLGVDKDTIFEDYLLTNKYYPGKGDFESALEELKISGNAEVALRELLTVKPEYLQTFFQAIEDNFRTENEYFATLYGVTPAMRERIRQIYLEG